MPEIQINFLAVTVAVVANFFFGFFWYSVLFSKAWAKEMGFDMSAKPPAGSMIRGMTLMVIGNFLMAYVLAHDLTVWNPEFWGAGALTDSKATFGLIAAFFIWLGYYVPQDLSVVAWEQKSWKLFGINTGYHFLSLVIVALILMYL